MPSLRADAREQPWKRGYTPVKSISKAIGSVSQVVEFKQGDLIIIGGQAGSSAKVFFDTAKDGVKPATA